MIVPVEDLAAAKKSDLTEGDPEVVWVIDSSDLGIDAPDDVVSMEERARLQEEESLQQLAEVRVIPSLSILVSS